MPAAGSGRTTCAPGCLWVVMSVGGEDGGCDRQFRRDFGVGTMPRYLFIAAYASEGAKGVLSKGGTARRSAIEKSVTELGGRLETFDFAFGGDDVYTIAELPDNAAAAAMALTVNADGLDKGEDGRAAETRGSRRRRTADRELLGAGHHLTGRALGIALRMLIVRDISGTTCAVRGMTVHLVALWCLDRP